METTTTTTTTPTTSTKKRSHACTKSELVVTVNRGVSYKFEDGILIGCDFRENIIITYCSIGGVVLGDAVCLIGRDGIIYSGHKSGHICRWTSSEDDDETGFCEFYSKAHDGPILYFAIQGDAKNEMLYSYGEDNVICVWDKFMTCIKKVRNVKDPKSQIGFEKLLESHTFTNEASLCDSCHDQYNLQSRYCCQRCPTLFDLCQRCSNFLSLTRCPPGHGCSTFINYKF